MKNKLVAILMVLTLISSMLMITFPIVSINASSGNGDINVQVVDISDGTSIPGSMGARVRLWGPDMSGGTFQGWIQIWKDADENGWANFTASEIADSLSGEGPFYYNIDTYSNEGAYSKVVLDGGFWGQFITYDPSIEKTYVVLTPKAMYPDLQVIWNGSNSKIIYNIDLGDRDDSSPDWNWDSLHIENSHNTFPPDPAWGDKPVLMIDWLEDHGYTYDDGGVANGEYCNLTIEKASEGYSETFVAYKSPDGLSYTIYLACQTEANGAKEDGSYDKINDVYTLTFDPTNVFDPGNSWTESPSMQDGVSYYAVLYVNLKDTPETGLNTVVTPGSVYSIFNPIKGPVENLRTGDRYYSIQAAIDKASPGDTILVHPGTYTEALYINKSISLIGADRDTTIIEAPSIMPVYQANNPISPLIMINTTTAEISGFKIDGKRQGHLVDNQYSGVQFWKSSGSISGCWITGFRDDPLSSAPDGFPIVVNHEWDVYYEQHVTISNNFIEDFQRSGPIVSELGSSATFIGNTIIGQGPTDVVCVAGGIEIGWGATAVIQNNIIKDNWYTPDTDEACGILIVGSDNVKVLNNTLQGNEVGVYMYTTFEPYGPSDNTTIEGNTIKGSYAGIFLQPSTKLTTVKGNTITDFVKAGIVSRNSTDFLIEGNTISTTVHDEAPNGIDIGTYSGTNGTIRENEISGCSWNGFTGDYETSWSGSGILVIESGDSLEITRNTIYDCDVGMDIESDSCNITSNNVHSNTYGFVFWNANPLVHHNNIYNNTKYGIYRTPSGTLTGALDARFNWWGNATGPYHPTLNPSGLGDNVSDNVLFEPWLLEQYPPPIPVQTVLYIDPAKVEYWTPSYDQVFQVNVKIENVTELTCYEFKLYWNTTLLDFDYAFIVEIWPLQIKIEDVNESLGRYWLGVTARGEDRFTGSATLVELYFKIKYDPIYPNNAYSLLNLNETVLGDASEPTPQPIVHMVHDGEYWLYSTKPKMKVEPSTSTSKKLGDIFNVNITVQDIVNLYDFEFWLYYNTTLLDIYNPYVQLGPLMSGATIYMFEWNDDLGYVHFAARLTSPAPSVNGTGTIAIVTFKVTAASVWPDPDLECTLSLENTKLRTIEGTEVPHDEVDALYKYTPVIGDLDNDGTVDLNDFYIISLAYGSRPGDPNWNRIADLNRDNIINILDLRTAARHYGEDC